MENKLIEIFDTTLRDGTQGEGVNLSVDDKLRIAEKLDEFGINIIEGGWPGSNPRDKEFLNKQNHLCSTKPKCVHLVQLLEKCIILKKILI